MIPVPAVYSVFVSVDAIVIPPSAFVIVTLEPAVKVATAGPLVPPINNCPFVLIVTADNVSVPES